MDTKRSYLIGVMLAVLALVSPIALFLWPIAAANWIPPQWLGPLVALFSVSLFLEVASHYQLSPREGFVEGVLKKYTTARDRIVYFVATVALLVVLLLSLSIELLSPPLAFALFFLGWLIAYGICVGLGTQALRDGVTPKLFKRMFRTGSEQ